MGYDMATQLALHHVSGPTIQTIGGKYFSFENPSPLDVTITDIAHSLSMLCRFTGHTRKFYSVAEHSYRVSRLVPPELRLYALLHDAAEAYIGDLSSPLKHMLPEYRRIEDRVEAAVFDKFEIPISYWWPKMHPAVKHADLILLATEQRDLMPKSEQEWEVLTGIDPLSEKIRGWSSEYAYRMFMSRYIQLTRGDRNDDRTEARGARVSCGHGGRA